MRKIPISKGWSRIITDNGPGSTVIDYTKDKLGICEIYRGDQLITSVWRKKGKIFAYKALRGDSLTIEEYYPNGKLKFREIRSRKDDVEILFEKYDRDGKCVTGTTAEEYTTDSLQITPLDVECGSTRFKTNVIRDNGMTFSFDGTRAEFEYLKTLSREQVDEISLSTTEYIEASKEVEMVGKKFKESIHNARVVGDLDGVSDEFRESLEKVIEKERLFKNAVKMMKPPK